MHDLRENASSFLNNLNIKRKLLLVFLCAFFVPMVVATAFIAYNLYRGLLDREIREAQINVEQLATHLDEIMGKVADLSDRIYVNDKIRQIVLKEYRSTLDIYVDYTNVSFLDDFVRAYPEIASIRLYVNNQTLLDNSYFIKTTPEIRDADWFRRARALGGRTFWTWRRDEITRKMYLSLVRQVRGPQTGEYVGVLCINIETDKINRILSDERFETLIALDGRVIYSLNPDQHLAKPDFLARELVYDERSVLLNLAWRGANCIAFIKSYLPGRGLYNHYQIVYIIPRRDLRTATLNAVFLSLAIIALALALSLVFIMLFAEYFRKRVELVRGEIRKVVQSDFAIADTIGGTDELADIHDALFETTANIKTLIDEVYLRKVERERLLSRQKDIQFKMLASQINPHFLYNTLETIRMKALSNGDAEVAHTVKLLAKILRRSLEAKEGPVSLISELELVSNYLDIQEIRFGDRISYDIVCLCDVQRLSILPLLIQPIVENSFAHGLESYSGGGFIYITIANEGDELSIEVRDNGKGIEADDLAALKARLASSGVDGEGSIGLVNVNQRIKLYYGERYGLTLDSDGKTGTTVTIRVPARTEERTC